MVSTFCLVSAHPVTMCFLFMLRWVFGLVFWFFTTYQTSLECGCTISPSSFSVWCTVVSPWRRFDLILGTRRDLLWDDDQAIYWRLCRYVTIFVRVMWFSHRLLEQQYGNGKVAYAAVVDILIENFLQGLRRLTVVVVSFRNATGKRYKKVPLSFLCCTFWNQGDCFLS